MQPLANAERWLTPGFDGRVALEVACVRSEYRDVEAALISLVLPAGVPAESVVPSTRERRADDVETRLRVRILGLNAGGDRVTAELLGMRRVVQSGPMDPTQPPSRCCLERHGRRGDEPPADPPPPHPGFDFHEWRREVGTRQLCVVMRAWPPRRARPEERERAGVDLRVVVRAVCQHAGGTSSLELLFDADTARQAHYMEPGTFVRGRVMGGGELLVETFSQTPAEYRPSIRR
ncbi:MAG: hypothetical protein GXP55_22815 [Deltaproteobacteria bacterium]|nr:hypothetical protein [Deltaproteobacteria bacterium]